MKTHISKTCQSATRSFYAIKTFKAHGMDPLSIYDVFKSFILSRLTYASPAWWGFASMQEKQSLQSVLNRAIRRGFYQKSDLLIEQICTTRDKIYFSSILSNPNHVLHHLLPPTANLSYNLRPRPHDLQLPPKLTTLICKNFLHRLAYETLSK